MSSRRPDPMSPTSANGDGDAPVEASDVHVHASASPTHGGASEDKGPANASGDVGHSAKDGDAAAIDMGVYGQNQSLAEQDRHQYEEARRAADEYDGVAAGVQPSVMTRGNDLGVTVAEGQVVGVTDADGRWTDHPLRLMLGDTEDRYIVVPYSRLNGLCIIVNIIIAAVCFGANREGTDVLTLIVGAVAAVMAVVMLWMTRQVQLVFNRADNHFRVEERRLLRFCCGPALPFEAPFDDLCGAGFDGTIGSPGDLYIDVANTHIAIGHRLYETRVQMMAEVMPWRAYIAGLRGMSPQEFEVAMMLRHVAGTILQRAARDTVRV